MDVLNEAIGTLTARGDQNTWVPAMLSVSDSVMTAHPIQVPQNDEVGDYGGWSGMLREPLLLEEWVQPVLGPLVTRYDVGRQKPVQKRSHCGSALCALWLLLVLAVTHTHLASLLTLAVRASNVQPSGASPMLGDSLKLCRLPVWWVRGEGRWVGGVVLLFRCSVLGTELKISRFSTDHKYFGPHSVFSQYGYILIFKGQDILYNNCYAWFSDKVYIYISACTCSCEGLCLYDWHYLSWLSHEVISWQLWSFKHVLLKN